MDIKEQLCQNVEANYQAFIADELTKSKNEIIDNAFKIHFYTEMMNFLTDVELEENVCKFYIKDGEQIIDLLYKDFCDLESASIATWSDIDNFVYNNYSWFNVNAEQLGLDEDEAEM